MTFSRGLTLLLSGAVTVAVAPIRAADRPPNIIHWHLGHLPPFLPTRHGFDTFYEIPYPNDFEPVRVIWEWGGGPGYRPPPLPLYRDEGRP